MKAFPECIPCLIKVALTSARAAGCDKAGEINAVKTAMEILCAVDLERPPPMIAADFLPRVNSLFANQDPFAEIKRESNAAALAICEDWARPYVNAASYDSDRLMRSIRISIAGNIIDFAVVQHNENWGERFKNLVETRFGVLEIEEFEKAIESSSEILFLADNAGEIVFDRFLVEELLKRGKSVKVAVKSGPALNDALIEDARTAGFMDMSGVEVITTGTAKMGVDLQGSSAEFMKDLSQSDLVVSKGQANFECLGETGGNIFFLTLVKCGAFAGALGINEGQAVLVRGRNADCEYRKLAACR